MSLVEMSLMGSAMILCVLLLRAVVRGRLPARLLSAMWMAALLRLLLPVAIPSSLSFLGLVKPSTTVYAYAQPAAGAAAASPLAALWLLGAAACALIFFTKYVRQRRVFQTALPAPMTKELTAALQAQHLSRRVAVLVSDRISTPLTYGLIRPRILLPASMERTGEALGYVIAHECGHIRRGDAAKRLLVLAALCLHWFNPLVFIMAAAYRRDTEQACDRHVVQKYGPAARAAYARTLLDLEERKGFSGILFECFSQSPLEERIRSIMAGKRATWAGVLAAVAVYGCTAAVFATSPAAATQTVSSVTVAASVPSIFYHAQWAQAPEASAVYIWQGDALYATASALELAAPATAAVGALGEAAPALSVSYGGTASGLSDQPVSFTRALGSGAFYTEVSGVIQP